MTKSSSKVKVAVRVRPFNKREIDLNTRCVVDMRSDQTYLTPPNAFGKQNEKKLAKTFTFDHCFWSMDPTQKEKFANQEFVFKNLGIELLDNAFEGYNSCIFAYGQTGSGKSYTMMGSSDQAGLIPRLCDVLFERIQDVSSSPQSFKVEVSYMEIYNEKVRDLLDPSRGRHQLRVREHKLLGPYVDGLQQLVASSAEEVQNLMSEGSKSRTVAATKMNAESSRSHAVFTLIVTQSISDRSSGISGERVSKLSLVDLAGSERSSKTGASGARLKEGSNINKSLTTLGLVISALADQSGGKTKNKFVPYRDSTLTWILKDNLGGNSRTTMVATLSPSADNYEETLSTLRYADRAKRIVNKAVVNEDPNAKIIRELREEVEKLQMQLKQSESMQATDLQDKLAESEKLIKEISLTWEEKLRNTELAHKKRQETLEKMGISLKDSGIKLEKAKCFLVNLNADPLLNELLVYYLKDSTLVGQSGKSDIQLSGLGINQNHAEVSVKHDESGAWVIVTPLEGARTCVNGRAITSPTRLRHGDRILWGNNHFFRVNIPKSAKKTEELAVGPDQSFSDNASTAMAIGTDTSLIDMPPFSYEYAQQEVLLNEADAPIETTIMNLEKEFQVLQNEPPQISAELNQSIGKLDEEERKKYESEIESLRKQLLLMTPSQSSDSLDNQSEQSPKKGQISEPKSSTPGYEKYKTWKNEREWTFRTSISRLRQELVRAQAFIREANDIAIELEKNTDFSVTLRIPAHNLTPNRKKGALLCEPAIQVIRQGRDCQIWSVEKLANRLVDMRDLYLQHRQAQESSGEESNHSFNEDIRDDPFNESEHGQILIGVANIFLTCLVQEAPLYYPVPIINQQGQMSGKLLVGLQRISGSIPDYMLCAVYEDGEESSGSGVEEESSCSTCSYSSGSVSGSDSSGSSGVGSSLSPDPPVDQKQMGDRKSLDSPSSLSARYPTSLSVDQDRKSRHKEIPQLSCRLTILEAQGLPPTLSHYVECQYTFLDSTDIIVVTPEISPDEVSAQRRSSLDIRFNHAMIFTCNVTEELVDRLTSHASLAIEVWGHRDRYHNIERTTSENSNTPPSLARSRGRPSRKSRNNRSGGANLLSEKIRSLQERWSEVMKRIQMEVTIQELGEAGDYEAVEIINKTDVPSVGIFQLKQGQSRRIKVDISPLPHSGTLPLICENVAAVYAGSICVQSVNKDKGLDSYQDEDLNQLRKKWSRILDKRKSHLDKQLKILSEKENKTTLERERESRLFDQWVMLTEERNAVSAPTPASGVPGAPASWNPPLSYEMHVPIVFLDLDSDPVGCEDVVRSPAGLDSELPQEIPGSFVQLPFVRPPHSDYRGRITSLVSWDSSMHDSALLNKVTSSGERIYIIVKVHVRLSHPLEMDLVLRKRICLTVYKQKGITAVFMRKMQGKPLASSGVVYEIVSNVPPSSSEGEDHEALAMMAASGANGESSSDLSSSDAEDSDNEGSQFEKYVMRATRSVDNILTLDRIRQEVALRDASVRDPKHSGRGADVVSILSKRNKAKASSSSSAYPAVQRRSLRTSATDSKVGGYRSRLHDR